MPADIKIKANTSKPSDNARNAFAGYPILRYKSGKSPPPNDTEDQHKLRLSPKIIIGILAQMEAVLLIISGFLIWFFYVAPDAPESIMRYVPAIFSGTVAFLGIQYFTGQYTQERLRYLKRRLFHVLANWALALTFIVMIAFALKASEDFSRVWLFSWFTAGSLLLIVNRMMAAKASIRLAQQGLIGERIAILGAGQNGQLLVEHLMKERHPYLQVAGIYDDRIPPRVPEDICGYPVLGDTNDLVAAARQGKIDTVVITLPWSAAERLSQLMTALEAVAVDVRLSPSAIGFQLLEPKLATMASVPMLNIWDRPIKDWQAVAKWIEDKVIATTALALLGPLMLLIALAIKIESRGPVFFRQLRFGFNSETIEVLKFRSMYTGRQDATGTARTVKGDPRVTRVGRFLRRSSLDELPQLLNVLRGEMSIVGPRPHALSMKVGHLYYFDAVKGYASRHRVRPGITGWAQVNDLRGEIDDLEKAHNRVKYDVHYVNNWSLAFDIRIIIMTFLSLIQTKNAY